MLFRGLLTDELKNQSAEFLQFGESQTDDLKEYLSKLAALSQRSHAEIAARFAGKENIGAMPAAEFDSAKGFSCPFAEKWKNHEEARGWALGILEKRTTFAADGSQIFIEREASFPVGAVQIGWFENPHDETKPYEKKADFFILSPQKLLSPEEPFVRETLVGHRRFAAEIEKISEFLQKKKGWRARGERMPLAFYDNTLLLSVALPQGDFQTKFLEKLVTLARFSRECEVPLVGYVDHSYARDLIAMLDAFDEEEKSGKTIDDVSLLNAESLKNWGDRTPFCYSLRRGLSAFIDPETGKSLVGFVYLKTSGEGVPARLDIPSWVYEQDLLDEVADVVRAECIIGLGYPYALETADQIAVITGRDREIFFQALQAFAKEHNLDLRVSGKSASKRRRR
jgi:hypothetical protein